MILQKGTSVQGMISNLQHCSVHDGPGIRTTVFLKGCNMRCKWCHNPETISFQQETLLYPDKCIGCGMCAEGCYSGARVLCGKRMTPAEVFEDIKLDQPYYGDDGGVTISGGEPLCQPDFTGALLDMYKENGINTAIETNMSIPHDVAFPVLKKCDFIMCDLKIMDDEKHIKYTERSNQQILENISRLPELGIPFLVRTPVIPSVNDTEEEIMAIGRFVSKLKGLVYYELLPYHPMGLSKGKTEGGFQCERFEKPTREHMLQLAQCLKTLPCDIRVAGEQV